MTQTFFVPGPLPNVNDIAGKNRWSYGKTKKTWTQRIATLALVARIKPVDRAVFAFEWREKDRRRNPDNIAGGGKKLIFDGLVTAHVIANDGWGQVAGWSDSFAVDAANPGVWVTLTSA